MDVKEQLEDFLQQLNSTKDKCSEYLEEKTKGILEDGRFRVAAAALLLLAALFIIFLFFFQPAQPGLQLRFEGAEGASISLIGENGEEVASSTVRGGAASFGKVQDKPYDYAVKVEGNEIASGHYDPADNSTAFLNLTAIAVASSSPTASPAVSVTPSPVSPTPQTQSTKPTAKPTTTPQVSPASPPSPSPAASGNESNQTQSKETTRKVSVCMRQSFVENGYNYTLKDLTSSSAAFEVFKGDEMACASYSPGCTFALNSSTNENALFASTTGVGVVLGSVEAECVELQIS